MHLPFYFFFCPLLSGSHSSLTFPSTFLIHICSYKFTLHMLHRLNQTFDFFPLPLHLLMEKFHATCAYHLPLPCHLGWGHSHLALHLRIAFFFLLGEPSSHSFINSSLCCIWSALFCKYLYKKYINPLIRDEK